jgi:hypothetical protein
VREEQIPEQEREYKIVGQEYHGELSQFGAVSPDMAAATPMAARPSGHTQRQEHVTTGGVKRKKTRRDRRR